MLAQNRQASDGCVEGMLRYVAPSPLRPEPLGGVDYFTAFSDSTLRTCCAR